jgi:hypothetical protein
MDAEYVLTSFARGVVLAVSTSAFVADNRNCRWKSGKDTVSMSRAVSLGFPIAGIALSLAAGGPAFGTEVRSLGAVEGAITTPEGLRAFSEQITGTPIPDRFGTKLPDGLAAADVERLLRPASDTQPLNTVGVKSLSGFPHTYAALLCTGGDIPHDANDTRCQSFSSTTSVSVHLGILRFHAGEPPKMLVGPLDMDGAVSWRNTGLNSAPDDAEDAPGDGRIKPSEIVGFDPAAYVLTPDQPTFGIRGAWNYGYSGGMSRYEALYLFSANGSHLSRVLAAPVSAFRMTAGGWHKDGTREHIVTESANLLIVLPSRTDGHADILLKSRRSKWQHTFRWRDADAGYR